MPVRRLRASDWFCWASFVSWLMSRATAGVMTSVVGAWTVGAMDDILRWGTNNGYVFLPLNANSPGAHHGTAY